MELRGEFVVDTIRDKGAVPTVVREALANGKDYILTDRETGVRAGVSVYIFDPTATFSVFLEGFVVTSGHVSELT